MMKKLLACCGQGHASGRSIEQANLRLDPLDDIAELGVYRMRRTERLCISQFVVELSEYDRDQVLPMRLPLVALLPHFPKLCLIARVN
jgi:hypothetical protein